MWVSNYADNTVTKLLASSGAVVGTYSVGTHPEGMAFDGTNIWVANKGSNNVTKLLASSGAVVGAYAAGSAAPSAVAFDGTNIWVASVDDVTELVAATGALVGIDANPACTTSGGVAFDGRFIWVACGPSGVNTLYDLGGSVATPTISLPWPPWLSMVPTYG